MTRLLLVITLVGTFFFSYACAADDSLILYFTFDEGAEEEVVADSSNYKNDGEIIGDAKWVDGKNGRAIELVAPSYVEVPEIPAYDVTDAISLMAWINTSTVSAWARVIDKSQWQDNGFDLALNMDTHAPLFEFFVDGTTSQAGGTTPIDDGEWHFIAGTFGNKIVKIYVDGVLESQVTSAGEVDIKPNDWPIRLGVEANDSKGQQYLGLIDEVAIFNRELSENEVQDILNNGITTSSPVESSGKLTTTWGDIKE